MTRNITRQFELQQRLLRQSETDQLTGLYNRRFFFEHCQQLRAGDTPCGLIMLDIDHFKQLNNRYGHQQGDRALQRFSGCIDALLRADNLFVRSGGEEFLILLPRIDEAGLQQMAEQIRAAVEALPADPVAMTVSLGTTLVRPEEEIESGAGSGRRVALPGQAGRAQPGGPLPGRLRVPLRSLWEIACYFTLNKLADITVN